MDQQQAPPRRVRFSEVLQQQDKEEGFEMIKQRPLPLLLQTDPFKGKENLGFPWRMSREPEPIDSEFAAAIAAAAFAVHSLEETRTEYQKKMVESFKDKERSETSRSTSRKGSFEIGDVSIRRRSSENEARVLGREITVRTNSIRSVDRRSTHTGEEQRRVLTKAEAWERDELKKIDKRYRKMISKITEWENEKKIKAKLLMERRKAEIERLRKVTTLHYESKKAWIERAARGARTQLEDKRASEESYARAKSRKIGSSGKIPMKCLCFECYR